LALSQFGAAAVADSDRPSGKNEADKGGAAARSAETNPLREYFPYGAHVSGGQSPEAIDRVCKDLAAHHMNAAWLSNMPLAALPAWLEAGRKHGIRIVPQGGGPPFFLRPASFKNKEHLLRSAGGLYKQLAAKYRDDAALLAWSLTEENPPVPWFYEALAELTQEMAKWDPNHPAITMDNRAPVALYNARVVRPKLMAMDSYPFWADGMNGPITPIGVRNLWTRQCRKMRQAAESIDVPFWMMGQGMSLTTVTGPGRKKASWRYPTTAEIRWQLWTAIQEGAKGLFYFTYSSSPRKHGEYILGLRDLDGQETPQYRMAGELGEQLKWLAPVLLKLDVAPIQEDVVYWENTPVSTQTHVHRETGQRFVIFVNHDRESIQRVGVELGYWPGMLKRDEKLYDLCTGRKFEYHTIKLATLLPGDGMVCLVGTDDQWKAFSKGLYPKD